jgi:DNA-binding GntR family transcriptional regulator
VTVDAPVLPKSIADQLRESILAQHDAIICGDAAAAASLAHDHITGARDRLLANLIEGHPDGSTPIT